MKRRASARLLADTRVYLSGPMDFVASRADEEKFGDKSAKVSVEVYLDRNNDNLIYLSEKGQLAVVPPEK